MNYMLRHVTKYMDKPINQLVYNIYQLHIMIMEELVLEKIKDGMLMIILELMP